MHDVYNNSHMSINILNAARTHAPFLQHRVSYSSADRVGGPSLYAATQEPSSSSATLLHHQQSQLQTLTWHLICARPCRSRTSLLESCTANWQRVTACTKSFKSVVKGFGRRCPGYYRAHMRNPDAAKRSIPGCRYLCKAVLSLRQCVVLLCTCHLVYWAGLHTHRVVHQDAHICWLISYL